MKVVNPATEEVREVDETPLEDIKKCVATAKAAQQAWGALSPQNRADILLQLGDLVESRKLEIASVITSDMGKPTLHAVAEVNAVKANIAYACTNAAAWLKSEEVSDGCIKYEPLGVAAVISPWNYPFLLPITAIIPALLAGNAVIFKPSEYSVFTGTEIAKLFHEIPDMPENVLQIVVGAKEHGKALVDQDINIVSFTGSTVAGKHIMRESSKRLHRVLLELGGMDAAIVLKDVDPVRVAKKIMRANCHNSGQVCFAVKRVYVEKEIFDEFVEQAVKQSMQISIGNPNERVNMGPLVAKFQIDKVEEIVQDAVSKGAVVHTGGKRLEQKGYYFPSTVLSNVTHEMKIFKEESFGPLLPIFPVDSWQEAVLLSNESPYGLTGSVWTNDKSLGMEIADKLEVGVAGVNVHGMGGPGTPWGGTKESGIGRSGTRQGMREFTNVKLVRGR